MLSRSATSPIVASSGFRAFPSYVQRVSSDRHRREELLCGDASSVDRKRREELLFDGTCVHTVSPKNESIHWHCTSGRMLPTILQGLDKLALDISSPSVAAADHSVLSGGIVRSYWDSQHRRG
jgi:hypothetical protein